MQEGIYNIRTPLNSFDIEVSDGYKKVIYHFENISFCIFGFLKNPFNIKVSHYLVNKSMEFGRP